MTGNKLRPLEVCHVVHFDECVCHGMSPKTKTAYFPSYSYAYHPKGGASLPLSWSIFSHPRIICLFYRIINKLADIICACLAPFNQQNYFNVQSYLHMNLQGTSVLCVLRSAKCFVPVCGYTMICWVVSCLWTFMDKFWIGGMLSLLLGNTRKWNVWHVM